MPQTSVANAVIDDAVHLACRAPSVHNSQPWRWVADHDGLHLLLDTDRLVATDASGRQALISCGAALDHLRVAMAAGGWVSHVDHYPNPNNHMHLATITFSAMPFVTDAHRRRADAILARRADRLPFAKPPADTMQLLLRNAVDGTALLDLVGEDGREQLAEASQLSESLRLYDSTYHAELSWWTAPFAVSDGIPHSSLVSAAESDRVDVGRNFPITHQPERRLELIDDQSDVLVISAYADIRTDVLACGEMLSRILLDATMAGLATCALTHMTEVAASRDIIGALTGRPLPQVLVRVGIAPALEGVPPPTPRRPLVDVLDHRV